MEAPASPLQQPTGSARTAAVLLLDSPRNTTSGGAEKGTAVDDNAADVKEIRLSNYSIEYGTHNMPDLYGNKVWIHMLTPPKLEADQAAGSEPSPAPKSDAERTYTLLEVPPSRRLAALQQALERLYANQQITNRPGTGNWMAHVDAPTAAAAAAASPDIAWPTTPDGPPAACRIDLPLVLPAARTRPPAPDSPSSSSSDDDNPTQAQPPDPPPDPSFPPSWLPLLGRSLLFLYLQQSRFIDPAAWDFSLLAALPRLVFLDLSTTTIKSALPEDLPARLPSLRVLDLAEATLELSEEQLGRMLVALSGPVAAAAAAADAEDKATVDSAIRAALSTTAGGGGGGTAATVAGSGSGRKYPLVLATASVPRAYVETQNTFVCASWGKLKLPANLETKVPASVFDHAATWRALVAAREAAFFWYARELWWDFTTVVSPGSYGAVSRPHLGVSVPMDPSMVRLVYDLGLLPAPREEEEEPDNGPEMRHMFVDRSGIPKPTHRSAASQGARRTPPNVRLSLAWPYKRSSLGSPLWSHEQKLHSSYRDAVHLSLSSRQWRMLAEVFGPGQGQPATAAAAASTSSTTGGGAAAAAAGMGEDDPFACEELSFEALEQRERMASGALFSACSGNGFGMASGGRYKMVTAVSFPVARELAAGRPHAATPVVIPRRSALAARTRARRLLVAALIGPQAARGQGPGGEANKAACGAGGKGAGGVDLAVVSPAERGTVSVAQFMTAVRLESRLYGRVRRVSILPAGHPARATTHVARYWTSVRAVADLLFSDPRVRIGVMAGAVPLAAVAEISCEELRALCAKLAKQAASKAKQTGAAEVGGGGLGSSAAGVLAAKAEAAADLADLDALQKQLSAGGRLDVPVSIHPEDWLPAEQSLDPLCDWHLADPRVWPHGTVLHGAVARGALHTVEWLLERGLPLNGRIGLWELTPLHLCCMRPVLWSFPADYGRWSLLVNNRLPALPSPPAPPSAAAAAATTPIPASSAPRAGAPVITDEDLLDYIFGPDDKSQKTAENEMHLKHTMYGVLPGRELMANERRLARVSEPVRLQARMQATLDAKLGLNHTCFRKRGELLFPGIRSSKVPDDLRNICQLPRLLALSPFWYSPDDQMFVGDEPKATQLQQPRARTLPCTAPATTTTTCTPNAAARDPAAAAAGDVDGGSGGAGFASGSAQQLAAAASPMLRLLLGRGADVSARSWSGLQPLHYAAASCGAETIVALVEAGASLTAPVTGTLVGPLHLAAYRAGCRWSGLPPRAAVRLLSCRPTIPPYAVLAQPDEWRGTPLFWLVHAGKALPAGTLGTLLGGLRAGVLGAGGGGVQGEGLPRPVVEGVARVLCYLIVQRLVEHCRVLLHHFPEAAGVALPPASATPLHVACMLNCWKDISDSNPLMCTVTGFPMMSGAGYPEEIVQAAGPYVPPGMAPVAPTTTSTTTGVATPLPPAGDGTAAVAAATARSSRSAAGNGRGRELLVLSESSEDDVGKRLNEGGAAGSGAASKPAGSTSATSGGDADAGTARSGGANEAGKGAVDGGGEEEARLWKTWPYPRIKDGPLALDTGEEGAVLMQACVSQQLQDSCATAAAAFRPPSPPPSDCPDAPGCRCPGRCGGCGGRHPPHAVCHGGHGTAGGGTASKGRPCDRCRHECAAQQRAGLDEVGAPALDAAQGGAHLSDAGAAGVAAAGAACTAAAAGAGTGGAGAAGGGGSGAAQAVFRGDAAEEGCCGCPHL
ncbi:hypothetical protein Agub_g14135 [Astrephomene gubernaculifera]|uniref:Uncharacterized protein n=1 Tax=Astrephomene gubernaculifera TaxID=47775 RepID=A0AAD3E581_9CHLO|nr:hypothetical protein Agub_g14135 [Astrephomene gubernaculifera]